MPRGRETWVRLVIGRRVGIDIDADGSWKTAVWLSFNNISWIAKIAK
jgi:hypothetical protein